jgi:Bacterial cell division membrane protein
MLIDQLKFRFKKPQNDMRYRSMWQYLHIDGGLFFLIFLLSIAGLIILYSAAGQKLKTVEYQAMRFAIAFILLFIIAQIPPITWQRSAPWIYIIGLLLLIIVLITGHIGKGAQRWLNLGFIRFQPSEIMKLGIPLVLAWYYQKIHLPITFKAVLIAIPVILIPVALTAKQPDLGTAILLLIAGCSVLFFAGLGLRMMLAFLGLLAITIPFSWYFLHDYQRQRVLTFLNPERDPLGAGYNIIQSKIAIGSGGIFGKGWLNGTQSNLHFLPEHTTDFIFAVSGEEFGLMGCLILLTLYLLIVLRGLIITIHAQDTFFSFNSGQLEFDFFYIIFH